MGKVSSNILNLQGEKVGKIRLPSIFQTPIRPDIVKRAVVAQQSHHVQPQGRDVNAGKRTTAHSWGTGRGISRMPRLRNIQRCALAPSTVGGRRTHPPKSEKKISKKIGRKEKLLAFSSAVAATGLRERVSSRGHIVDDVTDFPLVVTDDIEKLQKTKELEATLLNLGVRPDMYRVRDNTKIRAGKGKIRGRKKKTPVGPLIVIMEDRGLINAGHNIPGMDVSKIRDLNVEHLAPGTHLGRLTIWTKSCIKNLNGDYRRETQ